MARPRQPISLIQAKGKKHLTKAEIEDRKSKEVKAANDNIEAPSYLSKTLQKEFIKISNELLRIDIMTNLDCDALARYVVSEYNYQKVTKKLLKTGVDNDKFFNYLLMQEKLFKQSRQAASDLGLTISSRCKLVIPTKQEEKPPNKFSKFMK